jgi:hypothetical protein
VTGRTVEIPPPRAHLEGTLSLLSRFAQLSGGHLDMAPLLEFLDRPDALPASVSPEENSLKYDAYLARGLARVAWGVTVCDRFEGADMLPHVERLVARLRGDYRTDALEPFRARLAAATPMLTLGVAFDHPDRPPRLKFYLQEPAWGGGLTDGAGLRALAAALAPDCAPPAWLADAQPVGVVMLSLPPDGTLGLKAYVGAPTAAAAAAGAPMGARRMAADLAARSRLPGGWYYLTLRARPGQPADYAINRIYNHVQLGFTRGGARLRSAWLDVGRQFAGAGQRAAFGDLLRAVDGLRGVRVVPTATALEAGGTSADVYCGAWAMASSR